MPGEKNNISENRKEAAKSSVVSAPSISLPKGGGAIRGIGEKFAANPVTGTGSMSIPIATSPGRSGFGPQLSLFYDSGSGNGPFGLGWQLSSSGITRKTDKGLPRYNDAGESDVYILSGAEDLVPVLGLFKKNDPSAIKKSRTSRNGLKWIQAEHRVRPDLLAAQTRLMQGAAGIGLWLLKLDAFEKRKKEKISFPDSPF